MNTRKQRIEAVFDAAIELNSPEQREVYLVKACGDDRQLLQEIEELLRAHEKAGGFLAANSTENGNDLRPTLLATPLTEGPGTVIDKYKLLEKLGEGGFGVVYMAEQREPVKRRVALKIIKIGMDTREVVARFEAERQALAMMDHPNIAKILDAGVTGAQVAQASPPASSGGVSPPGRTPGETPGQPAGGDACATLPSGRPYFVMELVRGIKITDYCDEKKLSTGERLDLFIKVCQAVQHAHQKGIIHRDLKPSNILVTVNDGVAVPKVIDFGIAKATQAELTGKTLFTRFHQFLGTPAYMSPEQAEMTSLDIDTRSDIYSLGVLLYELLTGKTPFDAEELLKAGLDEMRRVIREKEPERPRTRLTRERVSTKSEIRNPQSEIDNDLDWIVMKCLEKDRARRYEAANSLASDVQRHLNNEPVVACPPSAAYKFQKLVRRNKLAFAAGASIAAALVLGLAIALWQSTEKTRAYNRAVAAENAAQTETQMLKDLLAGAAPEVAKGRDATILLEILDKTAERISKELTTQPAVESDLSVTVGRLYRTLGRPQKAEPFLRRALAVRNKVDSNGDRSDVLGSLGDILFDEGKLPEAEDLKRQALAMHRKFRGDDADTATMLAGLAGYLTKQGKLSEAKVLATESLTIIKKLFGHNHPLAAGALNELGLAEDGERNYRDAEIHLREAAAILEQERGAQDHDLQVIRNNLAGVLERQNNWHEAEILRHEVLAVQRKLLGDDHPTVAGMLGNLGHNLWQQGKRLEAEELFHEALEIQRKRLGNENPRLGVTLNNLGGALYMQGKLTEAAPVLREAVELYRRNHDWPIAEQRTAFDWLGKVLVEQGNFGEAEAIFSELVALLRKRAPDDTSITGALGGLAFAQVSQKKFAEAESVARECVEFRQKYSPNSWSAHSAQVLLGESLLGQKKSEQSEPLLLSGYAGMEREKTSHTSSLDQRRLRTAHAALIQLYEETSRPDRATEWKQKLADFDKPKQN